MTATAPKIIDAEAFEYLLKARGYDPVLFKAIHNHQFAAEKKSGLVHPDWRYCRCNLAQEIRTKEESTMPELETELTGANAQEAATALNTEQLALASESVLTFEQWKEAYNNPQLLRDAFNAQFCTEAKPVLEMTAEELNEKRFFLEQVMAYIKIQYRKIRDLETTKLEQLDEVERVKIRKIDAERRLKPSSENTVRQARMTQKEKLVADLGRTLSVGNMQAQKILADLGSIDLEAD